MELAKEKSLELWAALEAVLKHHDKLQEWQRWRLGHLKRELHATVAVLWPAAGGDAGRDGPAPRDARGE